MRWLEHAVIGLAAAVALVTLEAHAAGAGEARPSEADLRLCHEKARDQVSLPSYVERAPASPFPSRISGVGPWTGPVTGVPPPPVTRRREGRPPVAAPPPADAAQEAGESDPGPVDPRYREVFNACMRALGY